MPGGAATALFTALDEGQQIQASGPYGRFCLGADDSNQRYLLIGTGTGVTPYRAMLPQLAQVMAARDVEVVLLFGARTPVELIYGEDFAAFAAAHPRLPLRALLQPRTAGRSAPGRAPAATCRRRWRNSRPIPTRDIAYLCGNPNMVDAAFEALKAHGLPVPHIRREKYVSSK